MDYPKQLTVIASMKKIAKDMLENTYKKSISDIPKISIDGLELEIAFCLATGKPLHNCSKNGDGGWDVFFNEEKVDLKSTRCLTDTPHLILASKNYIQSNFGDLDSYVRSDRDALYKRTGDILDFIGTATREKILSENREKYFNKELCVCLEKNQLDPRLDPTNNIKENISQTKLVSYIRPTWDQTFLEVKDVIAKRGSCDRGRSGAVIVRDHKILSTGYVGAPAGLPHCDEIGHLIKETIHEDGTKSKHCVRTTHAELNAIINAAKNGTKIDGGTLYCQMTPCRTCTMAIINSGIKRVVCQRKYHLAKESEELFKEAKVELDYIENRLEEYPDQ